MSNSLTPNGVVALTGSAATIYTVPNATTFTVSQLHVANPTGSAILVNLYVVPPLGTAGATNAVLLGYSLAAGAWIEILKGDMWAQNSIFQGLGLGATVKLSGIQTV